jgi:penicillin V acylase-like amidase (Ntn superfamily)
MINIIVQMRQIVIPILLTCSLLAHQHSSACTVFTISKGDVVLAGNNEDWKSPNTKIWFVPAKDGKCGGVYFGFDKPVIHGSWVSQGGMNEKGLFFDVTATEEVKVAIPAGPKKPVFDGWDLIRERIMFECATVKEALDMLTRYQYPGSGKGTMRGMYIIGDATGDSAIIGAFGVVRKKGHYLVATNFQQSETRDVKKHSCSRYRVASDMLQNCPELTVDYCRKVLSATHQKGKFCTRYSNIYDLKKQRVYLYHMHDFNSAVVIDLKTELKKGKRTIKLPSLFLAGRANDEQIGP